MATKHYPKGLDGRMRDENGQIREKRSDTKIETLKKDYSEFENVNGNMHLGTLKDKFDVDSLDAVRRELRKKNK
jgi:hypothetical protein